jgi:D-threo-aldose 1-dehydrogenase
LCDRFLALGEIDFILLALRYTLLDQSADAGFLDRARASGVGIVVGAPFQSGILATGSVDGAHYNYGNTPADVIDRVKALTALCRAHDVPLKAAALQFPLQHPAVTAVLAGMRSAEEVTENVAMAAHAIPPSFWSALREEGLTS